MNSLLFRLILCLFIWLQAGIALSEDCLTLTNAIFSEHNISKSNSQFGHGKQLTYKSLPSASTDITLMEDETIMSLNTLNLFYHQGVFKKDSSGNIMYDPDTGKPLYHKQPKQKKPAQKRELAKIIKEKKPAFLALQEVEGSEALARFNQNYLDSKYVPFILDGNDSRSIAVAILIRKDLALQAEFHSFKNIQGSYFNQTKKAFARDYPLLLIWPRNADKDTTAPSFAIGLRHHKSQRDKPNDPRSVKYRKLEVTTGEKIHQDLYEQYNQTIPLMVMGDFNNTVNDLSNAPEFAPMYEAGFRDAFDESIQEVQGSRVTHTYHPHNGPTKKTQIDSIQLNTSMRQKQVVNSAGVYRYKDENGNIKPIPNTYDERKKNPSDHFPIWAQINFKKIFAD